MLSSQIRAKSLGDREPIRTDLRLELFVRDVAASVSFYVDVLGFRVAQDSDADYAFVSREGAAIGINAAESLPCDHPVRPTPEERNGRGVEIVVVVDDIHAAHAMALTSGWRLADTLVDRPWGLADFRVVDPDGYYVRVTNRSSRQ